MPWLQSIDTALFHFINRSLSNPLFDWLMPVLSGNGVMQWFVLAVFAGFVAALFGGSRIRLCALTMAFVSLLGNALVVNVIKHAVARPRPCMALPDVIERLGCTASGSMPSAHAANWFSATMIAFLFYPKSWRFMLPMALAVSFSRVYNGVHYPGDVLAGAILGAGYAAAGVIGLQAAWNWIGGKWLPLWHAKMPSLLNAECGMKNEETKTQNSCEPSALNPQPSTDSHWLRLGTLLIFAMLIGRWIYLTSGTIELSQDEAYQWIWSKHPALSYYSKPPAIAFIQLAGTSIFGDTEFGIRFFSPLFAAITSLLLLRFLAREIGARPSFCVLLAASATPLLGVGTILMTIDPPLVLCWTWALVAGWRAAQPAGKTRDWLIVGLAMGLGFLCKYTAFYQIICFGIFFALWPAARFHLRKPGPWLALLIFLTCTLPVVIWNSQHGWITAHHVAGNAGMQTPWHPTLRYFWDFIFSEFALLNPIFFIGAIWAMIGFWKFRRKRPLWLYFFCMGAPVFLGHLVWSFHSRILPNWIAPAILPMFCLMAAYWHERRRFAKPFFAAGMALGIFVIAIMYQSNLIARIAGRPLPGEVDPSRRVRAWQAAAALDETEREKLAAEGQPAFIIASHYGIAGLDSFYNPQARAALKSEPLVYCVDSDEPANQFYFWPEYDYRAHRQGQNAIYVSEANLYKLESPPIFTWEHNELLPRIHFGAITSHWVWKWLTHQPINRTVPPPNTLPPRIAQEFESVTDLGERDIMIGDRVFHREHLWACRNLK